MKRKLAIAAILIAIVALLLPGLFQEQSAPMDAADSVVKIICYHESGEMDVGSGFVFSTTPENTFVATCRHVVEENPERITVLVDTGDDFDVYEATVQCCSEVADVAVVTVAEDLEIQPLTLTEAGIGSRVYAIGYPFAGDTLEQLFYNEETGRTVTQGRATGFAGGLFNISEQILHTAPCREGLSGGPIVNSSGEAVGIVSKMFDSPKVNGADSTRELQKLCQENQIPYTHHISWRLVRDGILLLLILLLAFILPPIKKTK